MADDDTLCSVCQIHFGSAATLQRHMAAIHPAPEKSSAKRPAEEPAKDALTEEAPRSSEQVELAPLLAVLSDEQKDAVLLRAVQRDPDYFYERILEQASAPLTDEGADARLNSMDPEGVLAAVRWFLTIGVAGNALSLLVAASQRCLAALEELSDARAQPSSRAATSTAAEGDGEQDDTPADGSNTREEALLVTVEALPAAGALGALWADVLGKRAVRLLVGDAETAQLRLLLEGLQGVAGSVRAFAPAVLVGPGGETVERIADALRRLDHPEPGPSAKKKPKHE